MQRRDLLKAALLTPAITLLPNIAFAKDAKAPANALTPADSLASAMKYNTDATKAPERTDKKAFCHNCAKFNKCSTADTSCKPAEKNAAYAPCELFSGKAVAKDGWCVAWMK